MNPVETPAAATDPAAPAAPVVERPCPRCGTALTPEQDWCLACGAAVTTEIQRPPSWRLPLAIVASVVLLAGLALTFAFLELADEPEQLAAVPSPTPAATPPPAAPTPTPDPAVAPTPEAGATPTPDDDAAAGEPEAGATPAPDAGAATPEPGADDLLPTPTPDDGATGTTDPDTATGTDPGTGTGTGALADWPAGETAWTVVLFSGTSREEAETKAEGFAADGTPVGILRSDDYESLNAGYHVVFSGQYETRKEAQDAAEGLQDTASGAYARRVRPR